MRTVMAQALAWGSALVLAVALVACGPTADEPVSVTEGGDTDGYTATLPTDWPTAVPLPEGMNLESAGTVTLPEGVTFSASYSGTGDPAEVTATLSSGFTVNGFSPDTTFGGGSGGGVTTWKNGDLTCQLIVTKEGERTMVNITVVRSL